jgi:hypothetical protein
MALQPDMWVQQACAGCCFKAVQDCTAAAAAAAVHVGLVKPCHDATVCL